MRVHRLLCLCLEMSPTTSAILKVACALLLLLGCSSKNEGESGDASSEGPPVDGAAFGFGASGCGRCVEQACTPAVRACNDEPDCVGYLSCILSCPTGKDGNLDPACAAACPPGSSSAAVVAESAFTACRLNGPGAECAACGTVDGGLAYALLHENCPKVNASTPCATFTQNNCCNPYNACFSDQGCSTIVGCYESCPVDDILPDAGPDAGFFPSCIESCVAMAPQSLNLFAELNLCISGLASQAPECGGSPDPCASCLNANCAEQQLEQMEAPGGLGFGDCVPSCTTPSTAEVCTEQCEAEYPLAVISFDSVTACSVNACEPVCGSSAGGV
jgi:hypothetical protein